ncbi:UNVERIFIED_CONTAM: hypothetical protein Slati_2158200 [Sesamum latifolium]|uniref:Reverse transcriptase zinc-binding domain-containing protein n=1 Tax=Sesamum latifolium TaxID=2727402 RepID=A0AAW2WRS3_9LAMI
MWRSLWSTRDLLVAGLRWRVGDGKSIPIKGQPWLPRPGTFQLIGQPANLVGGYKDCILSIRLQEIGAQDELIWHFERSGKFSVKSAYQVARGLRGEAECSCPGRSWAFIWKSKVPPKIALFGWKCVREALPTTNQLRRRGVHVSDGCGACSKEDEGLLHVLFLCEFARLVWAVSRLPRQALEYEGLSVEEWFRQVHQELGATEWKHFLSVCWALWEARNTRLFEGRRLEAIEVIRKAYRVSSIPNPNFQSVGVG